MNDSDKASSRHWLVLVLLCCLVTILGGCDSGNAGNARGPGEPDPGANTLQAVLAQPLGQKVACPTLALSTNSAVPGEIITVTGVPTSFEAPGFRVIATTADGEKVFAPLFAIAGTPAGTVKFSAPLHPIHVDEGGDVVLELGDGEHRCPRLAFTVEPLPKNVPTDYAVILQKLLENWVDKTLARMGYNSATLLQADPNTLPPARLGLWLAKHFVSSNDPDALPAIVGRAANDGDLTLERILKASHFEQNLDAALIELDSVPVGRLNIGGAPRKARIQQSLDQQMAVQPAAGRVSAYSAAPIASQKIGFTCQEQAFDPDELAITTAAALSGHMLAAAKGYIFDGSTSGWLLGGLALSDVGNKGRQIGYAATAIFVVSTVEAARRALEPQEITDFYVEPVGTKWIEDRDPNNPLFWGTAYVRAKGKSFNLSEATLQSLINAIGLIPGPVGTAVGAVQFGAGPKALNNAIKEFTKGSCFRIRAPEYGPIAVSDKQWTTSKIEGDTVKLVSHNEYIGTRIGASTLVVSLDAEQFSVLPVFFKKFVIDVQPIAISVIPSFSRVQAPGEVLEISATAANATTNPANLKPRVPSGNGQIVQGGRNGAFYEVRFKTPSDRSKYPTAVRFSWQGRFLPGGPPRTADAIVDTRGKVEITTGSVCLLPGETLQLSAELEGFASNNQGVTWSTNGGRITNASGLNATLVAPGQEGSIQVTVTANADPSVRDTVAYTVANTCLKKLWYAGASLTLDGNGIYGNCGPAAGHGYHHDAEQEKIVARPSDFQPPPDVPPEQDLWYNRTESIVSHFTHTSTHYKSLDDGTCAQVGLSGHNNSSVRYSGSVDGTLSFAMDVDLELQCESYPDGDVACVSGGAGGGIFGTYYFNLGSEATYRLSGQLSCNSSAGIVGTPAPIGIPISIVVGRYTGGTTVQFPVGIETPDGRRRSPQIFSGSCTADQDIPIDVTFKLDAPTTSVDDLIVIQIIGSAIATLQPPGPPVPLGPGVHRANGRIDFSVKLEHQ